MLVRLWRKGNPGHLVSFVIIKQISKYTLQQPRYQDQWKVLSQYSVFPSFFVSVGVIKKDNKLDGLNNRKLFLSILEPGSPRSGCLHGCVLMRAFFEACRWLLSHSVLKWEMKRERRRQKERVRTGFFVVCLLSYKGINPMRAPFLWHHLDLITSHDASSNTITLWGRGLQYMHCGNTIQSIAPSFGAHTKGSKNQKLLWMSNKRFSCIYDSISGVDFHTRNYM